MTKTALKINKSANGLPSHTDAEALPPNCEMLFAGNIKTGQAAAGNFNKFCFRNYLLFENIKHVANEV